MSNDTCGSHIGRLDADTVIYRLEEAGSTLLSLLAPACRLGCPTGADVMRTALESYGWDVVRIRPPAPSSEKITRMDEAMSWLSLIPPEKYILRRVVGARSLVHPITDRHLFLWRRLSAALGADHKAVQRWHAQGIEMIMKALRDPAMTPFRAHGWAIINRLDAGDYVQIGGDEDDAWMVALRAARAVARALGKRA